LREDGAALIHEPLSALLAFKLRQARNGFNLLRSYYLQPVTLQVNRTVVGELNQSLPSFCSMDVRDKAFILLDHTTCAAAPGQTCTRLS
jgi:hypothetical protein